MNELETFYRLHPERRPNAPKQTHQNEMDIAAEVIVKTHQNSGCAPESGNKTHRNSQYESEDTTSRTTEKHKENEETQSVHTEVSVAFEFPEEDTTPASSQLLVAPIVATQAPRKMNTRPLTPRQTAFLGDMTSEDFEAFLGMTERDKTPESREEEFDRVIGF